MDSRKLGKTHLTARLFYLTDEREGKDMINYTKNIDFSARVYYIEDMSIKRTTLKELCENYREELPTKDGVAPRFYTQGRELWCWDAVGQNKSHIKTFSSEADAEHALLISWKHDLDNSPHSPIYYYDVLDAEVALMEMRIED